MDNEFSVRVQSNLNFPKGSPNSYRTCNTNLKKKTENWMPTTTKKKLLNPATPVSQKKTDVREFRVFF